MQKLTPSGETVWPAVFKPAPPMQEGKDPQFQNTVMWPKSDDDEWDDVRDVILEVATAKFGKKAEAMLKKGQLRSPIRDGDDTDQDYLEGHFYLTARSSDRPEVVDEDVEDIINTKDFYGGCQSRMDCYFFAYDKAGNRGVAAILNSVQKTGDGERKGGRRNASDAFDKVEKKGKAAKSSGKKKKGKKSKDELM